MTYDIYFHDDFDGRASAAVMFDFLRSRGDDILHYVPVDFDIQAHYLKDNFFTAHKLFRGKRNPAIVVDFIYHPKAALWFDHHATAFKRDDWKKSFHASKCRQWHPDYFSCCHAVLDALIKDFGYHPPARIRELARWLDVIDGARYVSAKQTIEKKEPAFQLGAFIEDGNLKNEKENAFFIASLADHSMQSMVKDRAVQKSIHKNRNETKAGLAYYKKHLKVHGVIAEIEIPTNRFLSLRFAPFYFYPKLLYAVRVVKREGFFKLSLGVNPWMRGKTTVHIGEFLKKHFRGAGGHKNVGAAEFETKEALARAVEKIIKAFK